MHVITAGYAAPPGHEDVSQWNANVAAGRGLWALFGCFVYFAVAPSAVPFLVDSGDRTMETPYGLSITEKEKFEQFRGDETDENRPTNLVRPSE
jgi:hypothetical protein